MTTAFTIRPAAEADVPALQVLIALSARALSREDYSDAEIEAAVRYVFGVDSELLADRSYFVVEQGDTPVACGGWSKRKTLFGGDQYSGRESGLLDPATEAAKIRAFFVHPDWARQGVGTLLLDHCEAEARRHGFTTAEMMATLPGVKLYRARGYAGDEVVTYPTPDGVALRFIPMIKKLGI